MHSVIYKSSQYTSQNEENDDTCLSEQALKPKAYFH